MLDPPEHRPYRQMLRPFFESKAIEPLEARVAEWTDRLLGEVAGSGECEFVAAIASRLPVAVFMELFGFPMERFDEFRRPVVSFFHSQASNDERNAPAHPTFGHLTSLTSALLAEPRASTHHKPTAPK